jgi:class 3 adenylate cyclase
VRDVLERVIDVRGDKHADIVFPSWGGALFVSVAPVVKDGQLIGAIAISEPLESVATRLSSEAGSKAITLYRPDGSLITSTVHADLGKLGAALAIPGREAGMVMSADRVLVRKETVDERDFVETLGTLDVRQKPALIMGVGNLITILQDRGAETRNVMIVIFMAVIAVIFGAGFYLARLITSPVTALVEATERIRRNDLDFELPVRTQDETGVLTEAFNEMTGGLRERERSRAAIERYMSPKVYKLIQTGELSMGGTSREITVFETDIRSFTSASEVMDPPTLIEFLNRYFGYMVTAVHKYDGEVDKFIGDAILAKFGATEWYPDHARKAVFAMIEMIEACDRLDEELRAEGKWIIRMGIGCNTGNAVVGNLGSPERMEYTIISDTVNTAARMQDLTKEFGWDLLISESTYQHTKDYVEVGEPWTLELRGQTRDTLIYPVIGRKGEELERRRELYRNLREHGRSIYADFYESLGIADPSRAEGPEAFGAGGHPQTPGPDRGKNGVPTPPEPDSGPGLGDPPAPINGEAAQALAAGSPEANGDGVNPSIGSTRARETSEPTS